MSIFRLIPSESESSGPEVPSSNDLGKAILLHNAHWFTHVRWIVVATFALVGFAGYAAPGLFRAVGLEPPRAWLLQLTGTVAAVNLLFSILARQLTEESPLIVLRSQLWLQILADLLAVTVLVHNVGSVDTFIAFTYLFHIVLACIFFSLKDSFLVTTLATGMYLACVAVEISGYGNAARIFVDTPAVHQITPRTAILMASSAVIVWFVVWYFAATLSQAVRSRDAKLLAANAQLVQADEQQNRMVLRTVHDLKAPFTGIESNIQLMRVEYWDQISEPVREIVGRIAVRAQTLRKRIRDILLLGDLKSGRARPEQAVRVDMRAMLEEVVEPLTEKAESRHVGLDRRSVLPVVVVTQKKRLAILISNLLDNAISYSREGGTVEVATVREPETICLRISDHGIGIEDDVLPHIFDEYYRSPEAAAFNKSSTGLGLAIVKEVAQQLALLITVISAHGKGTTFEIRIPQKEKNNEVGEQKHDNDQNC